MKKVIGFLAIVASFSSISSFAADNIRDVTYCYNPEIADAGYIVTVSKNEKTGETLASVAEQTIAGPRNPKTFVVEEALIGTTKTYSGKGFSLSISRESLLPTRKHPARMDMDPSAYEHFMGDFLGALMCEDLT